jgi:hypothetical protein
MTRNTKNARKANTNKQTQATKKEVTAMGKALRALGTAGGGLLGGTIGAPAAGSMVGNNLGAAISKWLGFGDYQVSQNSVVQRAASGIPMMHKDGQSVTIRHKEYLGQIAGSTGFTVQHEFPINPGMSVTFPWLSKIARQFQEYKVKGLVFHYIPTSGTAISSSSSALGSVMFQTTYRASDSAPSSKIEILNEYWANEVVPFETAAHPIECDPKENPFEVHYVRTGDIPSGDILLYDLGRTFVATSGMQSTNIVGDFWVTYEIELKKPLISSDVVSNSQSLTGLYVGGTYTASSFYNGTLTTIGTLPITLSGRVITFPKGTPVGRYLITTSLVSISGGRFTGTLIFDGASAYSNCVAAFYDPGNTFLGVAETAATDLTNLTYQTAVFISDPSLVATVTIPAATITGGTILGVTFAVCYATDLSS